MLSKTQQRALEKSSSVFAKTGAAKAIAASESFIQMVIDFGEKKELVIPPEVVVAEEGAPEVDEMEAVEIRAMEEIDEADEADLLDSDEDELLEEEDEEEERGEKREPKAPEVKVTLPEGIIVTKIITHEAREIEGTPRVSLTAGDEEIFTTSNLKGLQVHSGESAGRCIDAGVLTLTADSFEGVTGKVRVYVFGLPMRDM